MGGVENIIMMGAKVMIGHSRGRLPSIAIFVKGLSCSHLSAMGGQNIKRILLKFGIYDGYIPTNKMKKCINSLYTIKTPEIHFNYCLTLSQCFFEISLKILYDPI